MLVAALQLGPAGPSIRQTTERILALVDQAAAAGVGLAVLPELALTPYFAAQIHDDLAPYCSTEDNLWALDAIARHAAAAGMAIVVPYAEASGDDLYNSMAFYDGKGARLGTFRKMHIPGQIEPDPKTALTILEKRYFKPGDMGFGVFDIGAAKVGGLICYDRRFPEAYRSLTTQGADIICIGYNTPVMPGGTLAKARRASELAICGGAYSTGTHIIATGKAGMENGVRFIGGSFIAAPDGTILARAKSNTDEMITAAIDFDHQAKIRQRWNFSANRRPDAYVSAEPA